MYSKEMLDRLEALNIPTLFAVANKCGLKGDFGRLYSPSKVGGTLRGNIAAAIYARGVTESALAHNIATTEPRADKYPRKDKTTGAGASQGSQSAQTAVETDTNKQATHAANDIASAIAGAVAAALGSIKAAADPDAVREMVREELEMLAPRSIEITIGERKTEIEERVHAEFERIVRIINTRISGRRMHVWLVGPSGSGKSHLAWQVAKASGLNYYSTGAIQTPFQLVGFISPSGDPSTLRTPFRIAFEEGGVFAWDDVDGSDARAFVSFNEALSNGRFAFPDRVVEAHPDFVAIASANTWGNGATAEYVGRNRIDAATLTRFVRIEIGYDETLERDLAGEHKAWAKRIQSIRKAVDKLGLRVLVTPRHTLQGAALLSAGFPESEVERMTVFAGLDKDTESKIRAAA